MRLLDRYLLRELLIPLAYCLFGFLIFFCSFDLIAHLRNYQDARMTAGDCLEYYLVTTPELLVKLMPVIFLLSLLYAITNHARYNELTAIRAAGVSLWRISMPYLAMGFGLSVLLFFVNEQWVPGAQERAKNILSRRKDKAKDLSMVLDLKFRNESENRAWSVDSYNPITTRMVEPKIFCDYPDGSRQKIVAKSGLYTNGAWVFYNVDVWSYKSWHDMNPQASNSPVLVEKAFQETPELIKSEIKMIALQDSLLQAAKKSQLSIREICDYLRLHPRLSAERRSILMTQLQGRIADPLQCLVVVLIAIPFGGRSGRRNVFVGVASSIFICFAYFVLQSLCKSMGVGSYLPPAVAAWFPNVLFGITGIVLTTKVR